MRRLNQIGTILVCWMLVSTSQAQMKDDPLLLFFQADELEIRDRGDTNLSWDLNSWVGKDLHKLWVKSEGEYGNNDLEKSELQVLYSRAITSFWDLQVGFREDFEPSPQRSWAVIGLQGLAPYFFEIDAAFFIGESGRSALRIEAEYELLLSQRWVLVPEFEINFYGRNDEQRTLGAGLSDIELGLRLRYQLTGKLAPYMGVNWERNFGNTADFVRNEGGDRQEAEFVIGLHAWF